MTRTVRRQAARGSAGPLDPTLPVEGRPASAAAEPAPALLAGRYRLLEAIGSGGMGRVYRAYDGLLEREVAVKLLDRGPTDDTGQARGCAEEARAAARLAHPGIARVFDSGVEDGRYFLVMELVRGRTLAELLAEQRALRPLEAAALAARLADALAEAHRQGVIHCDVKPRNVVLSPDGTPKLVDFGIARRASLASGGPGLEDDGEIVGSAPYLAPEQARGEPLDARTDVYALGAVLYELLTGRPPFQGRGATAVIRQRLVADPPPPRSLNPAIPPELEQVTLQALAREPAGRYQSAGQLRDALRQAIRTSRGAAAASTNRVAPLAGAGRFGRRWLHPSAARTSWPFSARATLTAAAALLTGALLVGALSARPAPREAVAPPPTSQPGPAPTATSPAGPAVPPSGPAATDGAGPNEAERGAAEEARKKAEAAAREAEKRVEERDDRAGGGRGRGEGRGRGRGRD